jgi:hypothetical protein
MIELHGYERWSQEAFSEDEIRFEHFADRLAGEGPDS